MQHHVLKATIAASPTTPPTTPPAIAPTLDDLEGFGDVDPVGLDCEVPARAVNEAEAVVLVRPVAVACDFVAVDSGASWK